MHVNHLKKTDILTKVTKYNLIREQRMIYIDVHEAYYGKLADKFIAVPNIINIVAKSEFQGAGDTEESALADCLDKIKDVTVEELFPTRDTSTNQA